MLKRPEPFHKKLSFRPPKDKRPDRVVTCRAVGSTDFVVPHKAEDFSPLKKRIYRSVREEKTGFYNF